jgi:hypothetical protein
MRHKEAMAVKGTTSQKQHLHHAVIASEAKQSTSPHKERMDCLAEPVIERASARPGGSQ